MEFRKIFTHTDDDDDSLEIIQAQFEHAGELCFNIDVRDGGVGGVFLTHDRVASLHAVLGEWLYPVHTPEGPNRSLIEQMIERAVRDQVSAVLPLHLRTVAEHRPQECPGVGQCPEADPEPHDVGHPTYEDARPHPCMLSQPIFKADDSKCSECRGRWADHPGVQAARSDWLVHVSRPADCEARPPAQHPFTAVHDECGHLWVTHCAPALATAPECGKCGAPWSDTHGQPGDPCAPAPSAPAPAGPTWDDELWSATGRKLVHPLPVPVCPECAHSWPRHMPFSLNPTEDECSVRGCDCTRVRP